MIAAVCWVPKGAAKNVPIVADPPTEEEIRELLQLHEEAREASEGEGEDDEESAPPEGMAGAEAEGSASASASAVSTALAAAAALGATMSLAPNGRKSYEETLADGFADLDMDRYDEEDDEGVEIFGNGGLGAAYYPSNEADPYLVDEDEDEDEEEIEDMTIRDTDLIVLTARNEDDVSHLEVWVYETPASEGPQEGNVYVHHDIMLPAFPLCLSWMDCNPTGEGKGNYVAVGTMQPDIEIWDLDVVDAVEPVSVLGGALAVQPTPEKKAKKSKAKAKAKSKTPEVAYKEGSHTDAVLGLSWNSEFRNVIASASADKSVKVWDIVKGTCEHTMNIHTDKVQAVAWNLKEPTVLLSGSFDRTVGLTDMRAPQAPAIRWSVSADVESLAWDPHASHTFLVSLEDGNVGGYDVRMGSVDPLQGKALFTIHAHEKAVCCLAYNTAAPNFLATASTDKMVKLWDLTGNQPTCIAYTNPKVGAVFAASFCRDAPFLLALGGSKGNLHVWDTRWNPEVNGRFGKLLSSRRAVNNDEP